MRMMLNLNHKGLKVWKLSIELVKEVYTLTGKLPKDEKFGLINQIRRASVSIPSNIAEGASRKSRIERKRFYEISRSSLSELDTQIEICLSLAFLDKNDILELKKLANEVFALLSAMTK
jgi:four helix bundle protein